MRAWRPSIGKMETMCQQFGWQGVPASSPFIMETFQAPVACTFTQWRDNQLQEHPQTLKSDSPLLPSNKKNLFK